MKKASLVLAFFCLTVTVSQSSPPRRSALMNFDWKYCVGNHPGAEVPAWDDSAWQTVDVPHDASIYGPFVKDTLGGARNNGYRPRNIGWYRKTFDMTESLAGRRALLEFEAVYRDATVWVNGRKAGGNLNGYLDFQFDVTELLGPGKNTIAVRYDNTWKESSRWYTGEGIHRNVWLHTVDNLHVDRYGTYVATPRIMPGSARVDVQTTVRNDAPDSVICRLRSDILASDGRVVATYTSVVPMPGKGDFLFRQYMEVPSPQLWDLATPNLYTVATFVYAGDRLADTYKTRFGIRDVVMNAEQGLFLNGRKVFVNGVCLHHDLGPMGAAAFDAGYARRLERLKAMGCNGIRLSHNVYPKFLLDWCDENGMLVYDEMYDKWSGQYYGPDANFDDHWPRDVEIWIRRDRNHPSVFIWSVGNEVQQHRKSKVMNFETGKPEVDPTQGVKLYTAITDLVRRLDPFRMTTTALFPTRYNGITAEEPGFDRSEPAQLSFYMDVMSVNYRERFFTSDKAKYPQLAYILSEAATGEGGYSFFGWDHASSVGLFYWGGTEYIGESFGWPSKGWISGPIDLCDNLKACGYSIQSFYSNSPMVQAAVLDRKPATERMWNDLKIRNTPMFMHWNWAGTQGELDVQTFSNCEQVELLLNGRSLGRRNMADCPKQQMLWKVAFEPGELTAVGYNGGQETARSVLRTASRPVRVELRPERTEVTADGLDLAYFDVVLLDRDGNLVPDRDLKVSFSVDGPATIAGVANGDLSSDELWQAPLRTTYQGRAMLVLRAGRTPGKIVARATAPGMESSVVTILSTTQSKHN